MSNNYGVLCHVSSLNGKYGIGDFGKPSYDFLDFLKDHKYNTWQILPLNNTNEFNCPYSCFSSLTIDPMYVDVEDLIDKGLISKKDVKELKNLPYERKVDFNKVKELKHKIIDIAYSNIDKKWRQKLNKFIKDRPDIYEYSCYMFLLDFYKVSKWQDLDCELYDLNSDKSKELIKANMKTIYRYAFAQMLVIKQWMKVKEYANKLGISIIGDMPIYCDLNSFDVYKYKDMLKLDEHYLPRITGGVPPDIFSATGQNWGTCVYNWEYLKSTNCSWFINRIRVLLSYYDILRIDHYAGIVEHYEIDNLESSNSKWVKGGGEDFINEIKENFGLDRIVIEDLGILSDECKRLKEKYNLKGMGILQFAFDGNTDNPYLPSNMNKNSVYYLGNHDNNTFIGFLNNLSDTEKNNIKKYLQLSGEESNKEILDITISRMYEANIDTIILQIQDLLYEDEKHRMNYPGRADNCWEYRMPSKYKKMI